MEQSAGWVEEVVPVRGEQFELLRPVDFEELLIEEAFEREELLPYWAHLWRSAVALAEDLAPRRLGGMRVLELGCGLGLPSIVAARVGARVTATDWSSPALRATAANAERNGVALETLRCAWEEPDEIVARAPWDLVLAADVLYDRRNVGLLQDLLPRLRPREVLIADPGRAIAEAFLERAPERWRVRSRRHARDGVVRIHNLKPRA
ncbi:MAG TPA: 50S ribosomal protein L11 methyltransferase [Thermoleophilaceae bacterium]